MSKKMVIRFSMFGLVVLLLVSCMLMGCQQQPSSAPAESTPAPEATAPAGETSGGDQALRVAFCISHMSNEFMASLADSVMAAGTAAGVEVTVYAADLDSAKQISQIETAVNEGYDGIIVDAAAAEAMVPAIRYAQDAGIPTITLHDNAVPGTSDAFVGVNFPQGGELKMGQCAKDIDYKGDIAIMNGGLGHEVQVLIRSGYDPVLDANPDIKVIFEDTGNWVAEDAANLTDSWLASGKHLDAIVCNNDGMAVGVVSSLKTAGLAGQIKVYGLDAASEMLRYIAEGYANATILTDGDGEAKAAIDIIVRLINGETVPQETVIDMILITPENVDQYL